MFSQYIFAEFEQVKKIIVILLILNKSKNNRSFADFEQVKKIIVILLTLSKSKKIIVALLPLNKSKISYFANSEQVKK